MKPIIRKISAVAFAAGMLFASLGTSQAATTLLDLTQPGASLQNDDKIFYDFRHVSQVGDLNVPLDDIYVVPITTGFGHGIQFQSALWVLAGPGLNYDIAFTFNVKTSSGAALITDNHLSMVGSCAGGGNAQIAETVSDVNGGYVADKLVFINTGGTCVLEDHAYFTPYSELVINKDFAMSTGPNQGDVMFVSEFRQIFSQIPEPTSALSTGLLVMSGLLLRRRGRKFV